MSTQKLHNAPFTEVCEWMFPAHINCTVYILNLTFSPLVISC